MAKAKKVIKLAQKEIGTVESPPGSNQSKYGVWFGMNGQPWCAMFVSYVLDKAGINTYRHSYTPSFANQFKEEKRWHTSDPQPGDIVFFDFPDSVYRIQHVGFVESVKSANLIITIEGNTAVGDDDNGGKVMRRSRPTSYVVGYGRPAYDPSEKPKVKVKRVIKMLKAIIAQLRGKPVNG